MTGQNPAAGRRTVVGQSAGQGRGVQLCIPVGATGPVLRSKAGLANNK